MIALSPAHRFVLFSDAEDFFEDEDEARDSSQWPVVRAEPVTDWNDDDSYQPELVSYQVENGTLKNAGSVEEFFAWMVEHAPSAIFVQRAPPDQDEMMRDGNTWEYLISSADQAFAFRMRFC